MHLSTQLGGARPASSQPGGQRFNAVKHGLYAESILLPGEDATGFRRQRRALFHTYRPQTEDEAELVDAMAENRWLRKRTRPLQARTDAHLEEPDTDAAGRLTEPVHHTRIHSRLDVSVLRQRIDRAWHKARAQLIELQRLRRLGLVEGAVKLPADCYMEIDGTVYGPVPAKEFQPVPEPALNGKPGTQEPGERADPNAAAERPEFCSQEIPLPALDQRLDKLPGTRPDAFMGVDGRVAALTLVNSAAPLYLASAGA